MWIKLKPSGIQSQLARIDSVGTRRPRGTRLSPIFPVPSSFATGKSATRRRGDIVGRSRKEREKDEARIPGGIDDNVERSRPNYIAENRRQGDRSRAGNRHRPALATSFYVATAIVVFM